MNISKREFTSMVDSLQTFDKASKSLQTPLPKPKIEIGSTKSKENLVPHYFNDSIEHPNKRIRLSVWFAINNFFVFSIKSLNYTVSVLFLEKLSTLTNAKVTISTRNDNTWEQLGCVSHSPPTIGLTIALSFSLGTRSVRTQNVRVNFACTKRL